MARRSSGIVESGDRGLAEGDDATRNDQVRRTRSSDPVGWPGLRLNCRPGSLPSLGAAVGNPMHSPTASALARPSRRPSVPPKVCRKDFVSCGGLRFWSEYLSEGARTVWTATRIPAATSRTTIARAQTIVRDVSRHASDAVSARAKTFGKAKMTMYPIASTTLVGYQSGCSRRLSAIHCSQEIGGGGQIWVRMYSSRRLI